MNDTGFKQWDIMEFLMISNKQSLKNKPQVTTGLYFKQLDKIKCMNEGGFISELFPYGTTIRWRKIYLGDCIKVGQKGLRLFLINVFLWHQVTAHKVTWSKDQTKVQFYKKKNQRIETNSKQSPRKDSATPWTVPSHR